MCRWCIHNTLFDFIVLLKEPYFSVLKKNRVYTLFAAKCWLNCMEQKRFHHNVYLVSVTEETCLNPVTQIDNIRKKIEKRVQKFIILFMSTERHYSLILDTDTVNLVITSFICILPFNLRGFTYQVCQKETEPSRIVSIFLAKVSDTVVILIYFQCSCSMQLLYSVSYCRYGNHFVFFLSTVINNNK